MATEKLFIKVTQEVEARHRLNPDLLTSVLFSFSYTSVAQLSEVVRNNNGFQDDLKMIGRGSPLSGHYALLRVHGLHECEGKIVAKLPGLLMAEGNYHEVTWMSLRRLINLSTRGTHNGLRMVSQLGCMYSEARLWASLSQQK